MDPKRISEKNGFQNMVEVAEWLHKVPLLSNVSLEERQMLGSAMVEKEYDEGACIIKQGEIGDGFFIIRSGKAVVTRLDGNAVSTLCHLSIGDFFGEAVALAPVEQHSPLFLFDFLSCWHPPQRRC